MRVLHLRWNGLPDRIGIPFYYKGDHIWLRWPWKRGGRWLSLLASGTGEFGDAIFPSLSAMDFFYNQLSFHDRQSPARLGDDYWWCSSPCFVQFRGPRCPTCGILVREED